MTATYNDSDLFVSRWLRNLMFSGHINPGRVLCGDIKKISHEHLEGSDQFHAFAGIGGWSLALRMAGWPDDCPVWTGSCPCQPFSQAGRRNGFDDERHLWPAWYRLIHEHRPPVVFGEQVASKAGRAWFDVVSTDLEALDYAVGAASMPACGVGAPHLRQRLLFVGHTGSARSGRNAGAVPRAQAESGGKRQQSRHLAYEPQSSGATSGFWAGAEWIPCRDGKSRPVEPGTFPLANGVPKRVGRLRAYGNAIVPQVAAVFIRSVMDVLEM